MTDKSPIECARAYVEASNAHDIHTIEPMLSVNCRYVSSGVGEHVGREAIVKMMRGFFKENPEVHWKTRNWKEQGADTAVFEFTITLPSGTSGGREWVTIGEDGLITEIRVER